MKSTGRNSIGKGVKAFGWFAMLLFLSLLPKLSYGHCDSYDGPVIQDAIKAIEMNKVEPVLKWIDAEHEEEITTLFEKTIGLKEKDREIYEIVEKHFLETLVRLHREGENAPYNGLKPAGTTKPIVVMSDKALNDKDIDGLAAKVKSHFDNVLREKYNDVVEKSQDKEESVEKGRAYVHAYVEYTHFLEALHDAIEHGGTHSH